MNRPVSKNPEGVREISPGLDRRGRGVRSYPGKTPYQNLFPLPARDERGEGQGEGLFQILLVLVLVILIVILIAFFIRRRLHSKTPKGLQKLAQGRTAGVSGVRSYPGEKRPLQNLFPLPARDERGEGQGEGPGFVQISEIRVSPFPPPFLSIGVHPWLSSMKFLAQNIPTCFHKPMRTANLTKVTPPHPPTPPRARRTQPPGLATSVAPDLLFPPHSLLTGHVLKTTSAPYYQGETPCQ